MLCPFCVIDMFIITITQMFLSMFVVALTPDYTIAVYDNEIFVCSMIDHCDNDDTCIDTYQMIDRNNCFNCSTENNLFSDFCDDSIPFDYSQYVDTTFYYIESNITVNMIQIVNDTRFSLNDYLEFINVFSSDCLETRNDDICNDALYLSANIDQKIALLK